MILIVPLVDWISDTRSQDTLVCRADGPSSALQSHFGK